MSDQMCKDPTYGFYESNPLPTGFHDEYKDAPDMEWNDGELGKITRFRMLTDPGFPYYDISYCYGKTKSGHPVHVILPFHQLSKRKWKSEIIAHAKRDGVYAKGLGLFDAVSRLC